MAVLGDQFQTQKNMAWDIDEFIVMVKVSIEMGDTIHKYSSWWENLNFLETSMHKIVWAVNSSLQSRLARTVRVGMSSYELKI